ncbi:carbohydrate ABC transporter permease [Devriesea agamarum]|uniref:carbohydrate ABC transporter permease n=1 Tax=Devriesea agamarum TaxID=472569 RepID=UPI00071D1AAF|nr:sugar ABC transporter permease [Devriesea agamarum]
MTSIDNRPSKASPAALTPARGSSPDGGRRWRRYRPATFYAFTAPWIFGFVALTIFPLGFALWMSFTDYDGISPTTKGVGFANYARAFGDADLGSSLILTLMLMLVVVPLSVLFGLALAVLCNQQLRLRGLYRSILYLPAVLPVTAGALAFRLLFDQDTGPINGLLTAIGLDAVPWLQGNYAFGLMLAYMLWGTGASMVISLASLQSVPTELLEAAMVDGAGAWRRFWRITVPLISPMLLFQFVTGVIGSIQMFIPALLMGNQNMASNDFTSIPEGLRVYMLFVYQTYFAYGDFGYASAMLWLLFIVIVAITVLIFTCSRRFVFYQNSGPGDSK